MSVIVSLFVLSLLLLGTADAIAYTYANQIAWNSLNGSFCNGSRQSPINILTRSVVENSTLTPLRMRGWDTTKNGYVLNNGHTLKFSPSSSTGEAFTQTFIANYKLLQFHFHWGPNANVGSENTVNGAWYSGELHFVHQNTSEVSPSSQYTVVAVFLREDSSMPIANTIWNTLTSRIPNYNANISISNIAYSDMLPSNRSFFYFPGSLTTPLCNEIVEWFVLQTPVSVPTEFFTRIRKTQDTNGRNLTLNYRAVQGLNGRSVSQFVEKESTPSSAMSPLCTTIALLAFLFLALMVN